MRKLERNEMKKLMGGLTDTCTASFTCPGSGTVSCSGPTQCGFTTEQYACGTNSQGNPVYCTRTTGVDCGSGGSASCPPQSI
jgi:hypothetical protein